jgi:hypothetical protein
MRLRSARHAQGTSPLQSPSLALAAAAAAATRSLQRLHTRTPLPRGLPPGPVALLLRRLDFTGNAPAAAEVGAAASAWWPEVKIEQEWHMTYRGRVYGCMSAGGDGSK